MPVGAVADAEEALEHRARVGFHRQRVWHCATRSWRYRRSHTASSHCPTRSPTRGRAPATPAGLRPEGLGRDLVQRNAGFEVGAAAGLFRMGARQEPRLGPRMIAVALPGSGSASLLHMPLKTTRRSRYGVSGSRISENGRPSRRRSASSSPCSCRWADRRHRSGAPVSPPSSASRRTPAPCRRAAAAMRGPQAAQDRATGQVFLRANHETHIAQTPG